MTVHSEHDGAREQPGEEPPEVPDVPSEAEVVAELEEARAEDGARRYPSTIGGACYLLIMLAVAVGIAITVTGDWRLGVRWIAGSLVAGAVLRLVLPARDAGMLAVRHRFFDVVVLALAAGLFLFLAQTIPDQPV